MDTSCALNQVSVAENLTGDLDSAYMEFSLTKSLGIQVCALSIHVDINIFSQSAL